MFKKPDATAHKMATLMKRVNNGNSTTAAKPSTSVKPSTEESKSARTNLLSNLIGNYLESDEDSDWW